MPRELRERHGLPAIEVLELHDVEVLELATQEA